MAITDTTLHLQAQLRNDVNRIADATVRDTVSAWSAAWDEVSVDLDAAIRDLADTGTLTRSKLLRASRLTQALVIMQDRLETLAGDAGVRITANLDHLVNSAEQAQAAIWASQLPDGVTRELIDGWSRVDPGAIEAIVKRSTEQITSRLKPLSADATSAVRRELVRSLPAGEHPSVAARRMIARAEGGFNGGLVRATRIARTELLDSHRAGALASRKANTDVLAGWIWHCELSNRTCPACIALDGSLHPADEAGPSDHVSGRCTALPQSKTWRELGIDLPEPKSILVPARDRFGDLSTGEQQTILGPGRYSAWKAGDYPVDSWAVKHTNPDWRDSWQVSRAPKLTRKAA